MADSSGQWQGPERRTNLRMRALIDDLRAELRDNRAAVEYLREQVHALSVELEELRRAHNENRPSLVSAKTVGQR
jgi:predicted  nucleic acid-binding Zn-ribbon protein